MACSIPDRLRDQYTALTQGCGLVEFHNRTQIELIGKDRITFLHNLCTNDLRSLEPGQGCEAYLTTVQGRTLAHVLVFCAPNSLIVETAADQGPTLMSHFDHYLITEDVQIHDRTAEWGQWLFAGQGTSEVLQRFDAPNHLANNCAHTRVHFDGFPVWLRAVPWLPVPAYQLVTTQQHTGDLGVQLLKAGAQRCEAEAFHMARVESGFPWYPWDITDQNLPQEIGRDQFTLNLRKGCYLGQETVARLDALGHVNRQLCGLRFEGPDLPESGSSLTADEKPVGQVTSAAFSPRLNAPLALAYIRVSHSTPGNRLASAVGPAEVISLPLDSPE